MPIALLTWLGTYLIRDAARSTDAAMQAVLSERLAVADHRLCQDMREFTDQLDVAGGPPEGDPKRVALTLVAHPWVVESWITRPDGEVEPVADEGSHSPTEDARAVVRAAPLMAALRKLPRDWMVRSVPREQPFAALTTDVATGQVGGRQALWQTFVKLGGYHLQGRMPGVPDLPFASGWLMSDGDLIYWRHSKEGAAICARLDGASLMNALFTRVPTPGLEVYPGRLSLATVTGIPLHTWGNLLEGSERRAASSRLCSPPLTQWALSYTPAFVEFPKPYLFPILLGVSSGSVLVLALAWIFFRENERELRVAQQRVSFVNQVSHELKTPLTNIRLYADMAAHRAEKLDDPAIQRHLGVVEAETARLNRLIQNVLNYARQQRDRLVVQPKPIILDEVARRAVTNWRPLLESKSFIIETEFNGPAIPMQADADALEQILGNLLANVEKYADKGKWVAIRTETDGNTARVIVEDRGPGIPSSKRRSVFEPFERLRSDLNEGVSGTGIGLTISRELAELHGGRLEVCSVYRDGARFILTLPIHTA
ncbi:MAG TPA: HAMP domain-containing sensor histidine kinase [Prosthecobacter sp.]|nr:HAMP domain-containing sensor histidine kinase [Prosthecobacter sp.]